METRIKNKSVDIKINSTKEFWQTRVQNGYNLKTVLLNEDVNDSVIKNRNIKERNLVKSFLEPNKKYKILDVGCGIGRWVENLLIYIDQYTGIDYTEGFIKLAKNKYMQTNLEFIQMSATDINISLLLDNYDLSILSGVCMYINDKDLPNLFSTINNLTNKIIYLQESVSLAEGRLTLDKFYSNDLRQNYSAIYRTAPEYENLLLQYCTNFKLLSSGLLLDNKTGHRKETNAAYWILKRSGNDWK